MGGRQHFCHHGDKNLLSKLRLHNNHIVRNICIWMQQYVVIKKELFLRFLSSTYASVMLPKWQDGDMFD